MSEPIPAVERRSLPLREIQPDKDRYLTIDPARYLSTDDKEKEWTRLWPRVWLCAGRVSDIPEVGSWFRFDIGPESIIVARSAPDRISAVHNACQHRGNRIVTADFGKAASFVCVYHSWIYDLTGACKRVTDRQSFDERALCGSLDLEPVAVEVFAGCVWVNMDGKAPPLMEYLGGIAPLIDSYQMEKMHVARDIRIRMNCNWKVILDAFSESYHLHGVHPQAVPVAEDRDLQNDFFAHGHSRQWVPIGTPSRRLPRADVPNDSQKYLLADAGIDPAHFAGASADVRRAIQLAKRQPDNTYGIDYGHLTDNQLTDVWALNVFPNMQFNSTAEGVGILRYLPDADDPRKCVFHYMVLVPPMKPGKSAPAYMGVPADADLSGNTRPDRIYTSWDAPDLKDIISELYLQDVQAMGQVQAGMRSRGFRKVRFSEQEQRNQHQFAEMDRYLDNFLVAL